ncbi:MAG TPA: hypothetical protein VFU90_08025 [Candidatus Tumulicola sp.]|nr:hypothetical protein [Candidatus Tumulicola sp.]
MTGVLAVAALFVVAIPATGASAAKLLKLSSEKVMVPNGSPAHVGLAIAGCVIVSEGTLTVNDAAKDKLVSASDMFAECETAGESASGVITEAQMGGTGKTSMKGKISITKPGPCVYVYSKWKGVFAVPGFSSMEFSTTGKINKKVSAKEGCAATDTEAVAAEAADEALSPFEATLG